MNHTTTFEALSAVVAQTSHKPKPTDAVCDSPFSSTSSLLPRLHFCVCFIVAMGYWPFHNSRPLKIALVFFILQTIHAALHTFALMVNFSMDPAVDIFDLDLLYAYVTIAMGVLLCSKHIRCHGFGCIWKRGGEFSCCRFYLLRVWLFFLGIAGVMAHSTLVRMAHISTGEEPSCTIKHGFLVDRER